MKLNTDEGNIHSLKVIASGNLCSVEIDVKFVKSDGEKTSRGHGRTSFIIAHLSCAECFTVQPISGSFSVLQSVQLWVEWELSYQSWKRL